jgi:pimeloyl-ACP methyl ester carboxylesterase
VASYIYDLAQLIHQQELAPVSIVAHSLGGNVAARYAGIYPDAVRRLVVIEGIGPPPRPPGVKPRQAIDERMREWIDESRALSGRMPRRYASIEDALRRMQEENPHLSADQARHLTQHGVNQNEDGSAPPLLHPGRARPGSIWPGRPSSDPSPSFPCHEPTASGMRSATRAERSPRVSCRRVARPGRSCRTSSYTSIMIDWTCFCTHCVIS